MHDIVRSKNTSNYDDDLDLETPPHKIWVPSLNYMKDDHHLFLTDEFNQIYVNCVNIAPRPLRDAPHSKTKFLVKSSTTKMGAVLATYSKAKKVCSATLFHTDAFVFSTVVKVVTIVIHKLSLVAC